MKNEELKELIREEVKKYLSEGKAEDMLRDVEYISDLSKELDRQFVKINKSMNKDAKSAFKAIQGVRRIIEAMYEASRNLP